MRRDLACKSGCESSQNPCHLSRLYAAYDELPAEGSRCWVPYESARSRRSAPRSKEVARDDGAAARASYSKDWVIEEKNAEIAKLQKEKAELEQKLDDGVEETKKEDKTKK